MIMVPLRRPQTAKRLEHPDQLRERHARCATFSQVNWPPRAVPRLLGEVPVPQIRYPSRRSESPRDATKVRYSCSSS